jgi:hypothetical protein
MLSILHYWTAKDRLREADKTIFMMGGESECSRMVLAQRDMIRLEVEYYKESMKELFWLTIKLLGVILVFALGWKFYSDLKPYF